MGTQISIAHSVNSIANQSGSAGASSGVMQAIHNAASATGVDFSYLLKKASQESGLDSTAQSTKSSASGLFQFTSQTWLQMIKKHGADYGLGDYAAQITSNAHGKLNVADPAVKHAILALRHDPQISAEMAGELDRENVASLKQNVGGKIGATELYLAHFLGAGGAGDFIDTMRRNPNATAASVLPKAAAANPTVFYSKSGEPRTVGQIYQHFAQRFDGGAVQMAQANPAHSGHSAHSYSVASAGPISAAGLYSAMSVPSSAASLSPMVGGASAHAAANVTKLTQAGSSTLFTAMLLGQMDGAGQAASSSLSALKMADDKKKNALATLSNVG